MLRTDDRDDAISNGLLFRELTKAIRATAESVSPGECIVGVNRDLIMLYGRRRSVFPPLPDTDDRRFWNELGCDYVFVQHVMASTYFPKDYPIERLARRDKAVKKVSEYAAGSLKIGTLYGIRGFWER